MTDCVHIHGLPTKDVGYNASGLCRYERCCPRRWHTEHRGSSAIGPFRPGDEQYRPFSARIRVGVPSGARWQIGGDLVQEPGYHGFSTPLPCHDASGRHSAASREDNLARRPRALIHAATRRTPRQGDDSRARSSSGARSDVVGWHARAYGPVPLRHARSRLSAREARAAPTAERVAPQIYRSTRAGWTRGYGKMPAL